MAWLVFIGLALLTALYAWLLERYKHIFEPDLTWLEVVIGVALCVGAAGIYARMAPVTLTWEQMERTIWFSFVVGGIPIVLWQVWRMVRRRRQRETAIRNGELD